MTENQNSNAIRTACNTGKTRAWRNNIAKLQVRGYWVNFGIPGPGGSDLIGIHSLTITPEMVGKRVAVFLAIEVKSDTGKPSTDQLAFLDFITAMGGIAGVARSADEALSIISNYQPIP
jgi:VRR-NUC domain